MAKASQQITIDIEAVEDMTIELGQADAAIRKSLTLNVGDHPAYVASRLSGLARQAATTAQAIMILMANERDRELLEKRIRSDIAGGEPATP